MPWNYAQVQSMYPSTGDGFLEQIGDRTNLRPPVVANAIKKIIANEGGLPTSPSIVARARESVMNEKPSKKPFLSPTFGHVAQWLSEIAGPTDLDALLRHADTYLNPSWSKGGLYYARCDGGWDKNWNYIYVEPYTGNSAIGYARLNVKNGQKTMWDSPWTAADVDNTPWIDGVQLGQNCDCLCGRWDEEEQAMMATFRTWHGERVIIAPIAKNLPFGTYGIYINGELGSVAVTGPGSEDLTVELTVGAEAVDLVLLRG